jgi:hypothetical protein
LGYVSLWFGFWLVTMVGFSLVNLWQGCESTILARAVFSIHFPLLMN